MCFILFCFIFAPEPAKGQLVLLDKSVQNQVKFIHQLFGIAS